VKLTQGYVQMFLGFLVVVAELSVAVAIRISLSILHPQKIQRDMGPSHLLDEMSHIRQFVPRLAFLAWFADNSLESSIVHIIRHGPTQAGFNEPLLILQNCGFRYLAALRHIVG